MLSENGACEDEEVKHAVGKLREKSGIVCDKGMPIMLKAARYKTVVRPNINILCMEVR